MFETMDMGCEVLQSEDNPEVCAERDIIVNEVKDELVDPSLNNYFVGQSSKGASFNLFLKEERKSEANPNWSTEIETSLGSKIGQFFETVDPLVEVKSTDVSVASKCPGILYNTSIGLCQRECKRLNPVVVLKRLSVPRTEFTVNSFNRDAIETTEDKSNGGNDNYNNIRLQKTRKNSKWIEATGCEFNAPLSDLKELYVPRLEKQTETTISEYFRASDSCLAVESHSNNECVDSLVVPGEKTTKFSKKKQLGRHSFNSSSKSLKRGYKLKPSTNTQSGTSSFSTNDDTRLPLRKSRELQYVNNPSSDPLKCQYCKFTFSVGSDLQHHLLTHSTLKQFTCEECGRSFGYKSHLKRHLLIHNGVKPFTCEECFKSFQRKSNLTKHLLTHTGDKPYRCGKCGKAFRQRSHLKVHMVTHTILKLYTCDQCHKAFSHERSLSNHLIGHKGEKRHSCHQCGNSYVHRRTLNTHMKIHTGDKFPCEYCGKSFAQKGYLNIHLMKHLGIRRYTCEKCEKPFITKTALSDHISTHDDHKNYQCNQCAKLFVTKSNLYKHLITHTGLRKFRCEQCSKTFALKCSLEVHLGIHTNIKSYTCTQCGKSFRLKGTLSSHLRLHTGVKLYMCEICGKSFLHKNSLDKHLLIHKNVKAFTCEHCSKSFSKRGNLETHLRTVCAGNF